MAEKRLDITVAAKALGIEATEQQLKKLTRAMREAQGGGGFFGRLQGGLGRGSSFKEGAELLAGGGAVAGLGLAGAILNQAAERARDIAVDFALGKKSGGEMVEELAKSIPIYGNIIAAGRTFRGLIDGSTIAIAKMNEETRRTNELLDHQGKIINDTRKADERAFNLNKGGESNAETIKREAKEAIDAARSNPERQKERERLTAALEDTYRKAEDAATVRRAAREFGYIGSGGSAAASAKQQEHDAEQLKSQLAQLDRAEQDRVKSIEAERDARLRQNKLDREDAKRQFDADLLGRKSDTESKIPFKQVQAERDAIRERYAREQASIIKRLRDPNLDEEQARKLHGIQEALPAAMRDELFNAGLRKTHNRSEFDSQLRTTGAGDAAARKLDDMNKKFDGLNKLVAAIERNTRQTSGNTGPQIAR